MTLPSHRWRASPGEFRTAWITASLCIVLIVIASAKPAWFESSRSNQTPPTHEPQPQPQASTEPPPRHPPAAATAQRDPNAQRRHSSHATEAKPPHHATTSKRSAPASQPAAGYYVQLGAFSTMQRATALLKRATRHGFPTTIHRNKHALFAVWVGPEAHKKAAEATRKRIKASLNLDGFIIRQRAP